MRGLGKFLKIAKNISAQDEAQKHPFDVATQLSSLKSAASASSSTAYTAEIRAARHAALKRVAFPVSTLRQWVSDEATFCASNNNNSNNINNIIISSNDSASFDSAAKRFLEEIAHILTGTQQGVQVDCVIMQLIAPFSHPPAAAAAATTTIEDEHDDDQVKQAVGDDNQGDNNNNNKSGGLSADLRKIIAVSGPELCSAFNAARRRHSDNFVSMHLLFAKWRELLENTKATEDNEDALDAVLRSSFRLQLSMPSAVTLDQTLEEYKDWELQRDAAFDKLVERCEHPSQDAQLQNTKRRRCEVAVAESQDTASSFAAQTAGASATTPTTTTTTTTLPLSSSSSTTVLPQKICAAWRDYAINVEKNNPLASASGGDEISRGRALFVLMRGVADCEQRVAELLLLSQQQLQQELIAAAWCDAALCLLEVLQQEALSFAAKFADSSAHDDDEQDSESGSSFAARMATWIARHFELVFYYRFSNIASSADAAAATTTPNNVAERKAEWSIKRISLLERCTQLLAFARSSSSGGLGAVFDLWQLRVEDADKTAAAAFGVVEKKNKDTDNAAITTAPTAMARGCSIVPSLELRIRFVEAKMIAQPSVSWNANIDSIDALETRVREGFELIAECANSSNSSNKPALVDFRLPALLPLLSQRVHFFRQRVSTAASSNAATSTATLDAIVKRCFKKLAAITSNNSYPISQFPVQAMLLVEAVKDDFFSGTSAITTSNTATRSDAAAGLFKELWSAAAQIRSGILLLQQQQRYQNLAGGFTRCQKQRDDEGNNDDDEHYADSAATGGNGNTMSGPVNDAAATTKKFFVSRVPVSMARKEIESALLTGGGVQPVAIRFLKSKRAGAGRHETATLLLELKADDAQREITAMGVPKSLVCLFALIPGISIDPELTEEERAAKKMQQHREEQEHQQRRQQQQQHHHHRRPPFNNNNNSKQGYRPPSNAAPTPAPAGATNEDFAKLFG